jgi:hypothetical protein
MHLTSAETLARYGLSGRRRPPEARIGASSGPGCSAAHQTQCVKSAFQNLSNLHPVPSSKRLSWARLRNSSQNAIPTGLASQWLMCLRLPPPATRILTHRTSFSVNRIPRFSSYRRRYSPLTLLHYLLIFTQSAQDIEFDFNVQHDCSFAGCGPTGKRPRVQERIECSDATESFIEHCDVPRWIINTHSLHNGHLLRRCLPKELFATIPVVEPTKREEEHRRVSAAYRPKHKAQRAEAAEKRAAKRLKTEADCNTKVLGKRKVKINRDDDAAMGEGKG